MLLVDQIKSQSRQRRRLILVAIAGLAIRLVLAPFTAHPFDVFAWYRASMSILAGNLIPTGGYMMTPAWYYTIVPVSYVYHWLSSNVVARPTPFDALPSLLQSSAGWTIQQGTPVVLITDWLYNLLIKIPAIVSDIFVGLVVYRIVFMTSGSKAANISFILWILNPMVIWVSAVWGMYDSIPALFALLAIYFLLQENLPLCSIMASIAIAYKLYAVLLIPIFLIYIYKSNKPFKSLILPILVSGLTTVLLFLPLILHGLHNYFTESLQPGGTLQAFGLTYWSVEPFIRMASNSVNMLNILILVCLVSLFVVLTALTTKKDLQESAFVLSLALVSVIFFSYPTVNEQWFIWLLPSLLILSARKLTSYGVVIALSGISLVYSWINSEFVAFFLPTYSYGGASTLIYLASETARITFARLPMMALLGVTFSVVLGITIFSILRRTSSLPINSLSISNLIRIRFENFRKRNLKECS